MSEVTETLLEMHYFQVMKECFEAVFGLTFLRMLKPSPQAEAWVGFDQGWAHTTISSQQLYSELKDAIASPGTTPSSFLAYFLQFKTVRKMWRRNKDLRSYNIPYYRIDLSLAPNRTTGLSQHETLLRLSALNGALVYYACPMIFETAEVLAPPNLDLLQCVNISGAPTDWVTNQQHSLVFRSPDDGTPYWWSEPVPAEAISFPTWVRDRVRLLDAAAALSLIVAWTAALRTESGVEETLFVHHAHQLLPDSLYLVSLTKSGGSN